MFNNNLLNLPLYNWALLFIIYSFLGWLLEVAYAYKNRKYFVNRGFLKGPICPIYGCSATLLVVLLDNFKENILILFIAGTLLTTFLEYITATILENLFNTKWWDYTTDPFNIQGKVCLHFSLLWGGVSVLVVKIIHPIIESYMLMIPASMNILLYWVLSLCFLVDIAYTLNSLVNFSNLTTIIDERLSPLIKKHSNSLKSKLSLSNDIFILLKRKNDNE